MMTTPSPSTTLTAIWTIGHSTRSIPEFLGLLEGSRIKWIANARRLPGSRKYPQHDKDALESVSASHEIGYRWLPSLGGRRRVLPDSRDTAGRNGSFRGYADYMSCQEFTLGLAELLQLACSARIAILCAEAVWWRCHRSMIADELCVRGIEVAHILDSQHAVADPMPSPARVIAGKLGYAGVVEP